VPADQDLAHRAGLEIDIPDRNLMAVEVQSNWQGFIKLKATITPCPARHAMKVASAFSTLCKQRPISAG
jgi:hypothetical protein